MLLVIFTILATVVWAIGNLVDKYAVSKYIQNPMACTIVMGLLGLATALIISQVAEFFVPPVGILIISLLSGVAYTLFVVFYFKAIMIEEVSRVMPLFSLATVFVLIISTAFLAEVFTLQKYLGIFIVVAGSLLISLRKGVKFKISTALLLMVMSTLFWAVNVVLSDYVLNFLTYWNAFAWIRIGAVLPIPIIFYLTFKKTVKTLSKNSRGIFYLSLSEGIAIVGTIMFIIALSYGFAPLVSALGETQGIFVFLFATLMSVFRPKTIKEELNGVTIMQKLFAISLLTAGSLLIIF